MISKKVFAIVAFDPENEVFVVYIALYAIFNKIYPCCRAQIELVQFNKARTIVFPKYSNIADIFSPKLEVELSKYIQIKDHIINLINGKCSSNGLI